MTKKSKSGGIKGSVSVNTVRGWSHMTRFHLGKWWSLVPLVSGSSIAKLSNTLIFGKTVTDQLRVICKFLVTVNGNWTLLFYMHLSLHETYLKVHFYTSKMLTKVCLLWNTSPAESLTWPHRTFMLDSLQFIQSFLRDTSGSGRVQHFTFGFHDEARVWEKGGDWCEGKTWPQL